MDVREARRDDFEMIEALVRSVYHGDLATTTEWVFAIEGLDAKLESLREEFDAIGSCFVIATEGEKALGAMLVRVRRGDDRVWIEDVFMTPEGRKKGAAAAMMAEGVPADAEVCCEVNAKNEVTLETLKGLGFEAVIETVVLRKRAPG